MAPKTREMAAWVLKPHGDALIKVSQGALGFRGPGQLSRSKFAWGSCGKPAASKARSAEMYLLAMDFRLV